MTPDDLDVSRHVLWDMLEAGINKLVCSCGAEIHPDCDASSVSIQQAWREHLERST